MLFAITLGLGNLLLAHPLALQILKWGGAAMPCWMAWRIAAAGPADQTTSAPAGSLRMAAFQWANPHGWLTGVAAVAPFLDHRGGGALGQAVIFAILFPLVALPSCFPWLASGAALQRLLRTPRARRILHGAMAALLAASTIFAWARV